MMMIMMMMMMMMMMSSWMDCHISFPDRSVFSMVGCRVSKYVVRYKSSKFFQIILLHYNVLHSQTEFDTSNSSLKLNCIY